METPLFHSSRSFLRHVGEPDKKALWGYLAVFLVVGVSGSLSALRGTSFRLGGLKKTWGILKAQVCFLSDRLACHFRWNFEGFLFCPLLFASLAGSLEGVVTTRNRKEDMGHSASGEWVVFWLPAATSFEGFRGWLFGECDGAAWGKIIKWYFLVIKSKEIKKNRRGGSWIVIAAILLFQALSIRMK